MAGTASSPAVPRQNKLTEKEQCVAVVKFTLLDCRITAREIMTRKVGGWARWAGLVVEGCGRWVE